MESLPTSPIPSRPVLGFQILLFFSFGAAELCQHKGGRGLYDRQSQEEKKREKGPRDLAKRRDDARTVMTLREATVTSWLRAREGGTTWPRDDGNAGLALWGRSCH